MIIQTSVPPQWHASAFAAQRERPVPAATRQWRRDDWLAACTLRLAQLRPDQGVQDIASMARALWLDVAAFDPVIAAEMEYETWLAGDPAVDLLAEVPSL